VTELQLVLAGDSAHTPAAGILDQLALDAVHRGIEGVPHTIYQELWHIAYWQQITLEWVRGVETPIPERASAGFPSPEDTARESWDALRARFFATLEEAVAAAGDAKSMDTTIRCPSRPGMPVRLMTIREQLESLGAHNAYHFGRIVLLRQLLGLWPPASGGFSW
jgi:uncharacterized damage-inducible protein DinB